MSFGTFGSKVGQFEGGSVECGGETYDGPKIRETSKVTVGEISVEGWGTADVEFNQHPAAFNELSVPQCEENTGTWTGTGGELDGRSGTIHRLRLVTTVTVTLS